MNIFCPVPHLSNKDGVQIAHYDYSELDNLIKATYPDAITEYTYDNASRLVSQHSTSNTGEELSRYEYTYDIPGNQLSKTETKNGTEYVTTYTYDALGNPETMTDAMGNTTTYVYDALGRIVRENAPFDSEKVTVTNYYYDGNSNLIKTNLWHDKTGNDPVTNIEYAYDNMNNLIKTHGDTDYVEFEYDLAGRMTKRTLGEENGQVTTYTYDDRDNLLTQTDPLGQTVSYTYDFAGNVKTTTDKNGTLHQNTYGTWGVIRSESTNDDDRILYTYTYDSLGRLTKKEYSENGVGDTEEYEYDVFGRVKESRTDETEVEYTYDLNSNVIDMRKGGHDTNTLTWIDFEYDALNRLTSTDDGDIIYTYDANGNISSKNVRGVTTNYTYNKANLPTRITSPYADFSYTYRLDGQKKSETDLIGGTVKNYIYDDAGRLVYEEFDSNTQQFEKTYMYDQYGNRIEEQTLGEERVNYTYDANNRLTKRVQSTALGDVQKETNYFYDNNGNRTTKQELTYTGVGEGNTNLSELPESTVSEYIFNINNMLTGFQSGDTTATYTYGVDGMRKRKTVNGVETDYVWENGMLIGEEIDYEDVIVYGYGADGVVKAYKAYGENEGTTQVYIKNGHGDILKTVNDENVVSANIDYDAFGNEVENTSYYGSLGYAGEYQDEESGLIYLRARMYDPEIGAFISEDPIQDGNNWYSYCGGNPVMFVDPWGMFGKNSYVNIHTRKNNPDVCRVQKKLNELGYVGKDGKIIEVDGSFGPNTEYAVKQFQKDNGLEVDGSVGPITWEALGLEFDNEYEKIYRNMGGQENATGKALYLEIDGGISMPINDELVSVEAGFSENTFSNSNKDFSFSLSSLVAEGSVGFSGLEGNCALFKVEIDKSIDVPFIEKDMEANVSAYLFGFGTNTKGFGWVWDINWK